MNVLSTTLAWADVFKVKGSRRTFPSRFNAISDVVVAVDFLFTYQPPTHSRPLLSSSDVIHILLLIKRESSRKNEKRNIERENKKWNWKLPPELPFPLIPCLCVRGKPRPENLPHSSFVFVPVAFVCAGIVMHTYRGRQSLRVVFWSKGPTPQHFRVNNESTWHRQSATAASSMGLT